MDYFISKLFWLLAAPANLFCLLLLVAAFASFGRSEKQRCFGRKLTFTLALLVFVIAVFPVHEWLLAPLENRFKPIMPHHVDGIILLAGGENPTLTRARNQPALGNSSRRYLTFASLALSFPQAQLVFTGGNPHLSNQSGIKTGTVAREILQSLRIPLDHAVFEENSRNTFENALHSAALVHPKPEQNWLLVTAATHMPRAMAVFRKAGWNVFPAPTDYLGDGSFSFKLSFNLYDHLTAINFALREYFGLFHYWLTGKIDQLWPE